MQLNEQALEELNTKSLQWTWKELLVFLKDWIAEKQYRLAFGTSFGAEDQLLTEFIASHKIPTQFFTLDTGRLFPEIYQLWQKTEEHYSIKVEGYFPQPDAVQQFVAEEGINGFYASLAARQRCCAIRKVEPLQRALENCDVWLSGVRHEQDDGRAEIKTFEYDPRFDRIKVSPLLKLKTDEMWSLIREHSVPYNPMHDNGYPSIGCAPCTRAIQPGEPIRAGRWWWESSLRKECGLHQVKTQTAPSRILIYYATETNNSKTIAEKLASTLRSAGLQSRAHSIRDLDLQKLQAITDPTVFVAATHGDGDPPELARPFFSALLNPKNNFKLSTLKYAVLGLGDTSYPKFCQAAVDLDKVLSSLGAQQLWPIKLLDVDFENHTEEWIDQGTQTLKTLTGSKTASPPRKRASKPISKIGMNRLNPITAIVTHKVNLNDIGSRKETWHVELELETPVAYQAGDALGVFLPDPEIQKSEPVRLYSIASSPVVTPKSVHLTVALAWHSLPDGEKGFGKCSQYLAKLAPGDKVSCYVHANPRFRLPDDDRDMILIGPGTGVAPFRGFIQQRAEENASGRSWLFFGDQHLHCDFLYQAEWLDQLSSGTLTRLNVAFSRDQADKYYVQDELLANQAELLDWLKSGAHLYLCGSKSPMSEDVEKALEKIISTDPQLCNGKNASDVLNTWREQGRYSKDVY